MKSPPVLDQVQRTIVTVRGHRVILDADLAALYGVENRALLQAVKRNQERFPPDFMFELTRDEAVRLRSQTVILNAQALATTNKTPMNDARGKHLKYLPRAFTEQGVAMLSSVLRSARAIDVNIEIMRAFVSLRQMLTEHAEPSRKLAKLESRYDA
jgi:ORF6N domain